MFAALGGPGVSLGAGRSWGLLVVPGQCWWSQGGVGGPEECWESWAGQGLGWAGC